MICSNLFVIIYSNSSCKGLIMINGAGFNRNVLSEVNGYLQEELDKLEGRWTELQKIASYDLLVLKRDEIQAKLDALSQEILEFSGEAFSQNKRFYVCVTFVNLTKKITSFAEREDLFHCHFNSHMETLTLQKIRNVAVSFFSPQGNDLNNDEMKRHLIKIGTLTELDEELTYRALSNWIHTYKIPLHELELEPWEYLELAPYLTFLHFDEYKMGRKMNEEENYNFIKSATNVKILITKTAFYPGVLGRDTNLFNNFPLLKELEVDDSSFDYALPYDRMPVLEKLTILNPLYSHSIPPHHFKQMMLRLKTEGKTIDFKNPYNFISYLLYFIECRREDKLSDLVFDLPINEKLFVQSDDELKIIIENIFKLIGIYKRFGKFFFFNLNFDENDFMFMPIKGLLDLSEKQVQFLWPTDAAMQIIKNHSEDLVPFLRMGFLNCLKRYFDTKLGWIWIKHNFIKAINNDFVSSILFAKAARYNSFFENYQKFTEKNWDAFRTFLLSPAGKQWASDPRNYENENFREALFKVDPYLRITYYCNFPDKSIPLQERKLIDDYLRTAGFGNDRYDVALIFQHPILRSMLFEIYPEQIKGYFLNSPENNATAYREFIQTKIGYDWIEKELLSVIALWRLRAVTFDQYPALQTRVENYLKTDKAKEYIESNYESLFGNASFRNVISKKYPELLISYFLEHREEKITKPELDLMTQCGKTEEGKDWIGDRSERILSTRDDLRRIVWVSHPSKVIDYFVTKIHAVPTEEERGLLIALLQTKEVSLQMELGNILNSHLREIVAEVFPERLIECYMKEVLFFPITSRDSIIAIKFLSTPEGRAMIQANPSRFIDQNLLRQILFKVYPPTNPNNSDLYPIRVRKEVHALNIEIYPSMPLYQPDVILQAMLDNRPFTRIRIMHYGSPAIDASGLSKQFLSQLMQGLPKSKLLPFEKTESGFLQPRDTGMPLSNIQEQAFGLLGHTFAIAIKCRYPIGTVFSPELIRALYIGSSPFETTVGMNNVERLRYIKGTYDHELPENDANHPYALMKILCEGDHEEKILMAAATLNHLWDSDSIKDAIETKDLPKLQTLVVDTWFAEHKRYYDTLKVVAVGMMAELPFSIAGLTINQWQDLENVSPEQFSTTLQGKLSAEEIKANLVFERDAQIAQAVEEERRAWFFEWIDAHKDNRETLANFIQGFTGGTAMAGPLTIRLTTNVDGLFPHSCFNTADLHPDLNKESLFYEFNEFAEGRGVNFTRL